jgi:hypothetical protein
MLQAQDLVELAMEIAWHGGFNAVEALEGGVSFFGTCYLGTEEAPFELVIIEKE